MKTFGFLIFLLFLFLILSQHREPVNPSQPRPAQQVQPRQETVAAENQARIAAALETMAQEAEQRRRIEVYNFVYGRKR